MVTSGSRKTDMAAAEMHSGYTFLKKSWWHINHVVPSHSQKKKSSLVNSQWKRKKGKKIPANFYLSSSHHLPFIISLCCHCGAIVTTKSSSPPTPPPVVTKRRENKFIHTSGDTACRLPQQEGLCLTGGCRGGERHRKRAARITAEESVKASCSSRKHWARRLLHLVIFTLNKAPPLLINWCTSSF